MMRLAQAIAGMVAAGMIWSCNARAEDPLTTARTDLYACEGCEAVAERESGTLDWTAIVAAPEEKGERLVLEGVVYASDGRTPQPGVIVYLHQTNADGLYAGGTGESEWSRRHGRLRGWVRTGANGRYRFETIKPAPYPSMTMPAHIHLFIREEGKRPYYVDDVVFDGEFGVDATYRAKQELRGGSGIVKLGRTKSGEWVARRDIVLERHPK